MPATNQENQEKGLRHQLSAGQMAMVAVGGSIGTGLLLGSGAAIKIAGPGVILSFLLAASISWTATVALGELASAHPAAGSFGVYAELYLNPWAGFVSRAGYWAAIAMSVGAEMVASATYMSYWLPHVPALVWVAVFSAFLLLINLRSVGDFGRFEYWFAMIKLIVIFAFVVVGGALLFTRHVPQQYTSHGGFLPNGALAPLMAMSFALYTFGGVEFVAITTGESRSLADIPRAVRMTFFLLTAVYLSAIIILVGVAPWNGVGVTESPFVTVFRDARIPASAHVMNFAVLTAALSGSNAALYVASRMLFSLARTGWAPERLGRLNAAGSPTAALAASSFGIAVALILENWAPKDAFVYILGAALCGLMISWIVSLAAHIVFRRRLTPAQIATLPLRFGGGVWSSALGLALIGVALFETWWASHITLLSGSVYLIVLTAAYFLMKNTAAKRTMSS